jgi:DNA-binding CsgD family transcriptional regulator
VSAHQRVLALIGDVMGLLDLDEFSRGLLAALRDVVPADWCALNEVPADPPHTISLTDPPAPPAMHLAFGRFGHQNPLVEHYVKSRDSRAIRFSDLISRRRLHQLDLYREVYKPMGVEYQIAFILPSSSHRVLGVALSRGKRDFTNAERDLLNLARPYLIQAYRNALAHTRLEAGAGHQIATRDLQALGVTRRQAEILRLIAMGHSDSAAAGVLGIEVRTVHKHLQRAYRTLGVHSRSEAAQIAWQTTPRRSPMINPSRGSCAP